MLINTCLSETPSRRQPAANFKLRGLLFLAAAGSCLAGFLANAPIAFAADVIKIGAPLALTGPLADESKKQEFVWRMWAKKVNAAGGVKVGDKKMPVKLIEYDYQSQGQRAAQLAEKLITDDKVNFLFAPFGSGHTKIVATIAERYRIPIVACSSSANSVFNQGFKYLFGTLAPNGDMMSTVVRYFKSKMPKLKRVAILGRDDVFPKSMAQETAKAAKAAGLDVVYDELYPVGTVDFSAEVSAIKASSPNWIFVSGYTQDLVLARKQMADLGATAPIITMVAGPAYREFSTTLGKLANGVTSSTWWTDAVNYKGVGVWPTTKDFDRDFAKATNGAQPDYIHASCAAAGVLLQNAIERAGSLDKTKVRDALAKTNIKTFYGPIKFSPDGMNQGRTLPIIQVQKGILKVLYPKGVKTGDMQFIH